MAQVKPTPRFLDPNSRSSSMTKFCATWVEWSLQGNLAEWSCCMWWEESYSAKLCQCPDSIKCHQEKGYSVYALLIPFWSQPVTGDWPKMALTGIQSILLGQRRFCMITQEMAACWGLKPKADGQAHQCPRQCPWHTGVLGETVTESQVFLQIPHYSVGHMCFPTPNSGTEWEDRVRILGAKVRWIILKGKHKNNSNKGKPGCFSLPQEPSQNV